MLRSARSILNHRVSAADGEIGRCIDFVVDAHRWLARYIVVEGADELVGSRVLISPFAVNKAAWTSRRLVLDVPRSQVRAAPIAPAGAAPTSEYELALYRHYGWTMSGVALPPRGPVASPSAAPPATRLLFSAVELLGYGVHADDGDVGHVSDWIVDDDTWAVPHVVVEGLNWLSARKVIVATEHVIRVDADQRQLEVALSSAAVEAQPHYDPHAPVQAPGSVTEAPSAAGSSGGRTPRVSAWLEGLAGVEAWTTRGLRAALARIIQG